MQQRNATTMQQHNATKQCNNAMQPLNATMQCYNLLPYANLYYHIFVATTFGLELLKNKSSLAWA